MTYLQLINAVLRRLREDEVTSVTQDAYTKLIGDFVNESKREVEDAHNWTYLRNTIQVTTVPNTFRYSLVGAGERYRTLNVFNDSEDTTMYHIPTNEMTRLHRGTDTVQTGAPIYYDFNSSFEGNPIVDVWPVPDAAYVINFDLYIPQDDLTTAEDILTIHSWPVVLGAYSKALSERGEDGGQQYGEALMAYHNAMADAIAIDSRNAPFEMIWNVV